MSASPQLPESPLSLERYVFKRVAILASEKPDGPQTPNVMSIALNCARHQGEPSRFLITLDLKLSAEPGKIPSYTGEISIDGYFQLSSDSTALDVVIANGTGILFGAVREMLINITSRGPWPPLLLKTMNFEQMAKDIVPQIERSAAESVQAESARA